MIPCDVCLEPFGMPPIIADLPGVFTCLDCLVFSAVAGIGLADAADFLEMRRMGGRIDTYADDDRPGASSIDSWDCWDDEPAPAPALAAEAIRPARPDAPPDPGANEVRLWQYPPHCGQWYALAGTPRHPRSVQYGGCRTADEALAGIARNLAARGYRWDGGYEIPGPEAAI